nr:MMPL family transporter [Acidimicrobiia bacterium]
MKYRVAAVVLLVGIVAAGAMLGRQVLSGSSGGGWSHQVGEAWEAERTLARGFESGIPNLILVVDPVFADLDDADVTAAVATMTDDLGAHPGITQVDSYWTLGGLDSYASDDGSLGLVTARIGGPELGLAGRVDGVLRAVEYDDTMIQVTVGGSAVVQRDAREASLASVMPLGIAAVVSIGLVLLFLRNLPLTGLIAATSIIAAGMTMVVLWALGRFVDFTTLSVLLALAVTWGLATAGGFVFGHRFVAERRAGADRTAAVVATMGSAGRTVTLAAALAAAVLLSLAVMPTALVRTIAYATTVGVLAAGLAGIVVLGLLLSLFGAGLTTGSGLGAGGVRPGISDWVVRVATARPVLTATLSLVVLGAVSLLAVAGLRTGETAADSLPPTAPSRQVADVVADRFSVNEIGAAFVIGPSVDFADARDLLRRYTRTVSSIEGVARADSTIRTFADGTRMPVPIEVTERLVSDRATLVW